MPRHQSVVYLGGASMCRPLIRDELQIEVIERMCERESLRVRDRAKEGVSKRESRSVSV